MPSGVVATDSRAELVIVGTAAGRSWRAAGRLPRSGLLLSGVTPFSWVLHQFPGGVMLPNWCNAP